MLGQPDRVKDAIEAIQHKLDDMPQSARDSLRRKASMSTDELFVYQGWKAQAQMEGLLTLDECITVFDALGDELCSRDTLGWPIDTPLAERLAIEHLMLELGSRFLGVARVRPA